TGARRAAAEALSGLLQAAPAADQQGGVTTQVASPTLDEIVQFGQQVARLAGGKGLAADSDYKVGLADADAEGRRLSADALLLVTTSLGNQLSIASSSSVEKPEDVLRRRELLQSLLKAIWEQTGALTKVANPPAEPDPEVRYTARRTFEEMAYARR